MMERRREKRTPVMGSKVSLYCASSAEMPDLDAVAANVSDKGLCIMAPNHFDEGCSMRILGSTLGNGIHRATVMWCKEINKGLYRLGLSLN